MFEFGAGASTQWWAPRVAEIHAVEHDAQWFHRIPKPANGTIRLVECPGPWWTAPHGHEQYVSSIEPGGPWDVVLIDGMARSQSTAAALVNLVHDGLIILDDTDLEPTAAALAILEKAAFARVDFVGFRPGMGELTCTSVFSRNLGHWGRLASTGMVAPGRSAAVV